MLYVLGLARAQRLDSASNLMKCHAGIGCLRTAFFSLWFRPFLNTEGYDSGSFAREVAALDVAQFCIDAGTQMPGPSCAFVAPEWPIRRNGSRGQTVSRLVPTNWHADLNKTPPTEVSTSGPRGCTGRRSIDSHRRLCRSMKPAPPLWYDNSQSFFANL